MDIKGRILQSLRPRRDGILLRSDANGFGSPSQVSAAFNSLISSGLITRLNRGVYAKPSKLNEVDREALLTHVSLRVKGSGSQLKRRASRDYLTPTARYVRDLAKSAQVAFKPTYADHWARSVTKLAGDEVESDCTDNLLVALTRSGKMTPEVMVGLLIKHHRDLKGV